MTNQLKLSLAAALLSWHAPQAYGISATTANIDPFGVGPVTKNGGGAPVSVTTADLPGTAAFKPEAQIQVSQGLVRFEVDNSPSAPPPGRSYNETSFYGNYLDVLHFHQPMTQNSEQAPIFVTFNFRIDGTMRPDLSVNSALADAWVTGSFRASNISGPGGVELLSGAHTYAFALVPDGQGALAPRTSGTVYEADASGFVDTGTLSVTYRLQQMRHGTDANFFYPENNVSFSVEGQVLGNVYGDGELDFMNSMTTELLLPIGTTFGTDSGYKPLVKYYDPNAVAAPEAGSTALLFGASTMALLAGRRARRHA
jgi:hypothetical protein